jgi:hypothetical protein
MEAFDSEWLLGVVETRICLLVVVRSVPWMSRGIAMAAALKRCYLALGGVTARGSIGNALRRRWYIQL